MQIDRRWRCVDRLKDTCESLYKEIFFITRQFRNAFTLNRNLETTLRRSHGKLVVDRERHAKGVESRP